MSLELRLEYMGGGQFQTSTRFDLELASKKLTEGQRIRAKVTQPRSVRQNAYFHALIQQAFENQRAGPMFPNWQRLKAWLLIRAGHFREKVFDPGAMTPEVARCLRDEFELVDFVLLRDSRISMRIAKSVSFAKTESDEMGPVVDNVVSLICSEIVPGVTPDQLMTMARETAS